MISFLQKLFGKKQRSEAVKIEPEEPKMAKGKTSLTIYFKDGSEVGWSQELDDSATRQDYFDAYKSFTDWWKDPTTPITSEYFVFQYRNGETMFRREDIRRYNISIKEPTAMQEDEE